MTTETETPRAGTFVTSRLPWILGAGMFALFLATLGRWVTPHGLAEVMDIREWGRHPHNMGPVTFLATYPLRWMPATLAPLALNLFSAICAALALGLLARSVAILPHDRTFEQRQREQSEFSFLTIRAAWVPPLFAVLVCGLQLSFWEDAIQSTGEMFDLLLFAFVVRCLLEYRIAQKNSWLFGFALVYGLAMANNWAMLGFFPAFLVAFVWIKGLGAFNPGFMLRIAVCGLAGYSLFLMFPLLNMFTHLTHQGFWKLLHTVLGSEKQALTSIPRETLLLLMLTSILPVFVMGIRWASYFGDNSPLGIFLATSIFHIVHGMFFVACLWVALDAPISPRNSGLGYRFLPLYYLGALSIGYFSGYFLLIFGTKVPRFRHAINPLLRTVNLCVTSLIWLLLLVMPAMLVARSLPHIRAGRVINGIYQKYFTQIEESLPQNGAVVLSDDPFRLYYLQATLDRAGKGSTHLLIDATALVNDSAYAGFLARKNPHYQIAAEWNGATTNAPPVFSVIQFLAALSRQHELYYIHPSFGFFFERFAMEPHGLVYALKSYPTNAWDMPAPTSGQVTQNQTFWKQTLDDVLPTVSGFLAKPENPPPTNFWGRLQDSVNLKGEKDWMALPIGGYYARSLNYWGVELERVGMAKEAGGCFAQASELNPINVAARINTAFNTNFVVPGKEQTVRPPKNIEDYFGQRRNWTDVLTADGPLDEPNFRDALAGVLADGGNFRQAVQQLHRVKELAPHDNRVPLQLAQLMLYIQSYTNALSEFLPPADQCYSEALANTELVLGRQPDEPTALFLKSVALMQTKAYDQAIVPLDRLIGLQTNNYAARLNRAIAHYKTGEFDAARQDYEAVGNAVPSAYQVYYGLGEIAYQQKDTPNAIKNYKLYVANAPANTGEAKYVAERLKELGGSVPAPTGKP